MQRPQESPLHPPKSCFQQRLQRNLRHRVGVELPTVSIFTPPSLYKPSHQTPVVRDGVTRGNGDLARFVVNHSPSTTYLKALRSESTR